MTTTVSVKVIFNCSLERAFKTPMLCDISKVHTGFGIMPRATHCIEDDNWGKPGYSKKVFVAKSLTQKGGFASVDKVINEYTYSLHSSAVILYPINWLFAKLFWKTYMRRVLQNVRVMAYNSEPYKYD